MTRQAPTALEPDPKARALDSQVMSRPTTEAPSLERPSSSRRYRWKLLLAFWSLPALFLTASYLLFGLMGPFRSVFGAWGPARIFDSDWRIVGALFAYWYLWALLTPVVTGLGRRFPILQAGAVDGRNLTLHSLFGILSSILMEAYELALASAFGLYALDRAMAALTRASPVLVLVSLVTGSAVYWGVLAATQGWRYYQSARRRQRLLEEARMTALKAQIHPHFLFNTLHSVSTLMDHDVPGARRMIARLSDLLRSSLAEPPGEEVTLEEELELIRLYLDIEEVRFGDRLVVAFEIAPETRRAVVPHLSLQPLVENAVLHGIGKRSDAGRIRVSAGRHDDDLVIEVQDDGPGPGRVGCDNRGSEGSPGSGGGLGLTNTRARLAGLYGDAAGVELAEAPGGGCRATVRLPLRHSRRRVP
ncbi:MAG: histidine kinase [Acidobacteriota bacterium]